MNYQQTLDYLFSCLPMYQRIGAAAYKTNLDNTIALCDLSDNPQDKFKSVHIAGTNGKGSTSHILAAILQTCGYKTGLYTSPHLKDFRERIKINGEMISQDYVISFVEKYKNDFENISPSFFEMTVALAFEYFSKENVDIAVIETGLGGRLDSTNVVTPLVSVITNIGWDHMNLLGDTLEKIAGEKAGIIKSRIPVVVGETQGAIKHVFIDKAKRENSEIKFADEIYKAVNINTDGQKLSLDILEYGKIKYPNIVCDLPGIYQSKNIITSLQTIDALRKQDYKIPDNSIYKGIQNVKSLTGFAGRWTKISESPLTICDVGHNKQGILEVLKMIEQTPHEKLHFVLGMTNDKDVNSILELLPEDAIYYFCKAKIPRALDENELQHKAATIGLRGNVFHSVNEAVEEAQQQAGKNDLVFIGGSTFVVAEII